MEGKRGDRDAIYVPVLICECVVDENRSPEADDANDDGGREYPGPFYGTAESARTRWRWLGREEAGANASQTTN
jgi:hypothetical protein